SDERHLRRTRTFRRLSEPCAGGDAGARLDLTEVTGRRCWAARGGVAVPAGLQPVSVRGFVVLRVPNRGAFAPCGWQWVTLRATRRTTSRVSLSISLTPDPKTAQAADLHLNIRVGRQRPPATAKRRSVCPDNHGGLPSGRVCIIRRYKCSAIWASDPQAHPYPAKRTGSVARGGRPTWHLMTGRRTGSGRHASRCHPPCRPAAAPHRQPESPGAASHRPGGPAW